MKELFGALLQALKSGADAVLCTIIASSGSTPRGSGAKMAVFADGSTMGTVGGGAVEYESVRLAKQALAQRATFTHGFDLTKNQTADIGMICGGQVTVYFQFLDAAAVGMLEHIVSLFARQQDTWLVTKIADSGVCSMAVYARDTGLEMRLGDDIMTADILPLASARATLSKGEPSYYVEPLTRAETVYVFGGGHVSQELVPLLAHIGFAVVVYEDRPAFADIALFPGAARTVTGDFTELSAQITVRAADYAVIMTRGHQADFEVLRQVLQTDASYIGVIGSKHKIAATNQRLLEAGIPPSALSRVHTPIGLPIGAETPAEIAVSVAAELIAHRAGVTAGGK